MISSTVQKISNLILYFSTYYFFSLHKKLKNIESQQQFFERKIVIIGNIFICDHEFNSNQNQNVRKSILTSANVLLQNENNQGQLSKQTIEQKTLIFPSISQF